MSQQPIKITEAEFSEGNGSSGIYSITNILNNKTYYGSSTDCNRRWREHKTALRHGKHHNIHLQRAWDLYGNPGFKFQIVEKIPSDRLIEVEQQYLDFTKIFPSWCYNISKETEHTNRGVKWSEKSRQKLSRSKTGTKHSEETRQKMSVVHKGLNTWTAGKPANNRDSAIYTFRNVVTSEIFTGIRLDFQKKYNLSQGGLGDIIRGDRKSHKNWVVTERYLV